MQLFHGLAPLSAAVKTEVFSKSQINPPELSDWLNQISEAVPRIQSWRVLCLNPILVHACEDAVTILCGRLRGNDYHTRRTCVRTGTQAARTGTGSTVGI
jgi:hypothetical protein